MFLISRLRVSRLKLGRLPASFAAAVSLLLILVPAEASAAPPAGAAASGWSAAETDHFRYLVQQNDRLTSDAFAATYGPAAELAYDEISLLFKTTVDQKIAIYVYSDDDAFDTAKAALPRKEIDGIDAVADPKSLDISIQLSRFASRSDVDAENQLRHATSHILAGVASGFNIPRGFDEGIAQYVEFPNMPKLARIASIVQTAYQKGPLLSWSDINRESPPDSDEELISAEGYATIAYLIQHQGLSDFQRFLAELKVTPAWRDAMKTAYSPSTSDSLYKQWRDKIPAWSSGDWRWNLVAGFDLNPAKALLSQGNYHAALDQLQLSEQLFMSIDDQKRRDEVETLKAQSAIGIQAEELMVETQQELERHTYDRAIANLAKAKTQYDQLPPEQRPDELIATYEALATAGNNAITQLGGAAGLSNSWSDYPDARSSALAAGTTFSALGDEERRDQANGILSKLDRRQRRLILLLGALSILTLAWLLLWLRARGATLLRWD
jgi:hypothetical protein